MRSLDRLTPSPALAGAWCDADAATSALLEALSFATPALERYFIRAMAAALPVVGDAPLDAACREFLREEAEHTRAHRRLNAALLGHLGAPPPGLAQVAGLLELARRRLAPAHRIALVATLEHFAAVLSQRYLERQANWDIRCDYARQLFALHAQEEIGHRAVAFDLWRAQGGGGRPVRALAIAAALCVGTAYLGAAVPWILHRKSGRRLGATCAALISTLLPRRLPGLPLKELFSFARDDFHPRTLSPTRNPS